MGSRPSSSSVTHKAACDYCDIENISEDESNVEPATKKNKTDKNEVETESIKENTVVQEENTMVIARNTERNGKPNSLG